MLTIGRVTFTAYNPWRPRQPLRLQRWQMRAFMEWQDRADALDEAPVRGGLT